MLSRMRTCRTCGRRKADTAFYVSHKTTCKACKIKYANDYHLLVKYGLTPEQYAQLEKGQGGVCAICHKRPAKALHVDHDHKTDMVRGLLCSGCNTGLGGFRDSVELLRAAIQYLHT